MLHLLDDSLEAFLRTEVPLSPREVNVVFDAPDRDWGAAVTRPTLNLYLWDVRINTSEREAGMQLVEDEEGRRHHRPQLPRIDCRYLVTAWTNDLRDEHALLGAVLETLLVRHEIAAEHLQGAYAPVRPVPTLLVVPPDASDRSDFWSALGGQLKPGLDLLLTATVDATALRAAGPPVERYEIAVAARDGGGPAARSHHVGGQARAAAGATVRSPRGQSSIERDGTFLVRAEPGDEVTVESGDGQTGEVPAAGAGEV